MLELTVMCLRMCAGSLNDVLEQDGCLPEPVVWDFLHQLASGLCYLHSSGVLYCDLRPVKVRVSRVRSVRSVGVNGEDESRTWGR